MVVVDWDSFVVDGWNFVIELLLVVEGENVWFVLWCIVVLLGIGFCVIGFRLFELFLVFFFWVIGEVVFYDCVLLLDVGISIDMIVN